MQTMATEERQRGIMSLRDVLIDELRDLYSAENQLVKALPKTAKGAESEELKQIFTQHLEETKGHVERLKQAFEHLGKKPTGKHCSGMEGAVDEVKEALEEDEEGALLDAGIVGAAARVEHYEIAGYSAAIMIATTLGETEIVSLLKQTLSEEQNAAKLVMNAAKGILKQAYAQERDEAEPEKKPKSAKEKKSEADSKKDEREAAKNLGKSAEEAVAAAPGKKK
jgi:ferritin-like metal-binding protein YciE